MITIRDVLWFGKVGEVQRNLQKNRFITPETQGIPMANGAFKNHIVLVLTGELAGQVMRCFKHNNQYNTMEMMDSDRPLVKDPSAPFHVAVLHTKEVPPANMIDWEGLRKAYGLTPDIMPEPTPESRAEDAPVQEKADTSNDLAKIDEVLSKDFVYELPPINTLNQEEVPQVYNPAMGRAGKIESDQTTVVEHVLNRMKPGQIWGVQVRKKLESGETVRVIDPAWSIIGLDKWGMVAFRRVGKRRVPIATVMSGREGSVAHTYSEEPHAIRHVDARAFARRLMNIGAEIIPPEILNQV